MILALVAVLAVALLAFLMRHGRDDEITASPSSPSSPPAEEPLDVDQDGDADEAPAETIAITSDGWAFVPDGRGVQLIPPADPEEAWRAEADPVRAERGGQKATAWEELYNPPARRNFRDSKPGEHMNPGDLLAARVQRGAPGVDPWRLEALGRDREYRHWPFETEDAARLALELIEGRIVSAPRAGDDPDVLPIGEADFVLARAEAEAIEAELASDEEPDPR